jgi:Cu(I)/Ag(I) efflux system membrane fusion protein
MLRATMNARSSLLRTLSVCLAFASAWACSGGSGEHAGAEAQAKREALPNATTPPAKLLVAYLAVQQALAGDDVAGARKAFDRVHAAAQDPTSVSDAALRQRIDGAAQKGSAAQDLPAAREAFGELSKAAVDLARAQPNPLDASLRVAFCPMAFNNAGAKWLQLGATVDNPYFGSQMLTCGSLDAELKPGQKLVAK